MADDTTLEQQMEQYRAEHRKLLADHKQTYQLMGGVTLVAIGMWIGARLFGGDPGFTTNVYTEALSILVTVLILNWFADRRARSQRKHALKLQLGSQSNDFALEAKRLLELEKGWLEEALQPKKFPRANWQGLVLEATDLTDTDLFLANLAEVILYRAKLTGAKMRLVNLTSATLWFANLTQVDLRGANLTNADLMQADLTDADLVSSTLKNAVLYKTNLTAADLRGASDINVILWGADLTHAILSGAHFNYYTILPDGKRWTPDTDVTRFTDPNHPQYWRSDDPLSPAYRGA